MNAHTPPEWNDEHDRILIELRLKGVPFSKIGARLGRTKNSCISRHRRTDEGRKQRAASDDGKRLWSPEDAETAKQMRLEGHTTRVIGARLRRSCQSVSHLLSTAGISRPVQRLVRPKEKSEPVPVLADGPFVPGPVDLLGLTSRSCRWPLGDPRFDEFRFCGEERVLPGPYCGCHRQLAYRGASNG